MAEITPDKVLASLQTKLAAAKTDAERAALQQQISERQAEIAIATGVGIGVGFGRDGMYIPSNAAKGTTILEPTYEQGVYTKTEITGNPRDPYGRAEFPNKVTLYDAQGKPLSAADAAKTEIGLNFAASGRDIGFGPGFIAPGVRPDIEFATFNSTRANMPNAAAAAGIVNGPSTTTLTTKPFSSDSSSSTSVPDAATLARRTAQQEFRAALTDMGLADLADTVDEMIKQDFTTAQIRLELPKTKAYELRFPGMKALREAKQAISEATYISMEKGYLQTLSAYGLDTSVFGSRTELGKYIANLVSPREFEERVDLAATRVKENPDLITQFKVYYPEVDNSALTAYLLDPSKGMDIIKKQIRTAEIGAASVKAGFTTSTLGTAAAEALIGATGTATYAALSQSFARAKELASQQSRLAAIEGAQYQDIEAIGAIVGGDITKTLASQARAEREVSRFAARGGVTATSLQSTGTNI